MKPLGKKKKKGVVILFSAHRGRIKTRHLLFGVGHGGDAPGKNSKYISIYVSPSISTDRRMNKQAEKHDVIL